MATYTDIYKNLGVKLIVNQTSQNVANNTSVVSWYVYAYKISSHNPWNNFGTTPFKATINGSVVYNANVSYDLRGSITQQLISSGTSTITHTADGTKSIAVEAYANYTSTGFGYGAVTAKGSLSLTSIPRVSIATLSTASFDFGQNVTLKTNRSSNSFTHSVFYVIGTTEYSLATGVEDSKTIAIPTSVMSSYPSATSASMVIRTKTFNGATELGVSNISVTVNVPSTIIPTIGSVAPSDTVAAANIFTVNDEQYIRGLSKLKATAGSVAGSNGSTIKSYHYRLVDANGKVVPGTETISTSSSHTYGTFSFPTKAQGSAVYKVQCRVLDSRNRYSSWRDSKVFRFHYYEAPTINLTGVTRSGASNTSIIGNRTYNVYSLKEGGTTERNTGTFVVKFREKGATAWTAALGGATGLSLSNSSATFVTGTATNKFYEIQATVTDKIGSAFSSIVTVGSEFVTMEILRGKAVGIGTAPTTGGRNLYVGDGGAHFSGAIYPNGGIEPTLIPDGANINSYQTPGFFYCTTNLSVGTMSNTPSNNAFSLTVLRSAGVTQYLQEYGLDSASNRIFYRSYYSGAWSDWENLKSTPPIEHFVSQYAANQLNSVVKSGAYRVGGANGNLFPNGAYGQMLTIYGGGDTVAQMGFPYNGSRPSIRGGNPPEVGASGSWNGWKELAWHSDVPAAYTPTSGGSGDNRWIRFPSGHQICWGSTTTTGSSKAVTFPRAFTATPMITVSGHHANHSPSTTLSAASASAATFYIVDGRNGGTWGSSYTSGLTATLRYIAVGIG